MQCPKCKQDLSKDVTICPNCGYDLNVYQAFHAMMDDLSRIKTEASALTDKIEQMQKQFINFEAYISKPMLEEGKAFAGIEEQEKKTRTAFDNTAALSTETEVEKFSPQQKLISIAQPIPDGSEPQSHKPRLTKIQMSEIKLGQKWLLIAGVVLSVMAVGWFLKYSFEQNWVGPAGRVIMAYLMGIVFLGAGELFRRRNFLIFGLYIIGGSIATLYFATFAAFQIYNLLSHTSAFGIMILVTILAGSLSLFYETKWLAVLGLIGGFMTPIILSTGTDNQMALMTYMTILNSGILCIAFFKQWQLLNYLGFFFTWLLFSGWYFPHYTDTKFWQTITFLNIFFLIYAFVPFVYHILREHRKQLRGVGIIIPNAYIAFGYSFAMISDNFRVELVSIVTIVYAAIFLWMARFIYRRDREQIGAFVMLLGQSMLFLVLTVPILFSKQWVTFFWAIQAVVILWTASKLQNRLLYHSFVILLLLALSKFLLYDYTQIFLFKIQGIYFANGYGHLFLERLIISAVVLIALLLSSQMVTKSSSKIQLFKGKNAVVLWTVFVSILFLLLNFEVGAFFHDYALQARFAAISVLWTLFSIMLMIFGFVKNNSLIRKYAIGLFLVTMIKVFLGDMSNVSTPYRIISFMVLGIMLIGASYLYHRFKDRLLSPDSKKIVA